MDPLEEEAIYNERHVKVICIGAGASGICLAYKLQRSFQHLSLTVYDKNPRVGGTWYENRYPGCACDVPSHNYVYSFEPKSDFTSVYAGSDEIQGYFEEFVDKHDLRKYFRLSHIAKKAQWDDVSGQWDVEVQNLDTGEIFHDTGHILVHACGYLNKPLWPKGIEAYRGIYTHSASYDSSINLAGKDVLLIGAGSSAVQILPAIQPVANKVTIFIRSPTWLLPDISTQARQFTAEELDKFAKDPESILRLRKDNEKTMNSIFTVYLKDTVLQNQSRILFESDMRKILGDKDAEEHLIPNFEVGCKRVVPSGYRYLKSLKQPNVATVYSGVELFTTSGLIDANGQAHDSDVIISATGFDTSYIPSYPILGLGGLNLQKEWAESIVSYMGVGTLPEFPNAFTLLGPYSPVSNGPTLVAIEAQTDYICAVIDRYQTEPSIHSIAPKKSACSDFVAHVAKFMEKTVWAGNCRNSHNNHTVHGRTPTTWPGSTLHYLEAMREPRWEDWDIRYDANRFSWLGNGTSQTEWDPTADLAYYIRQDDDGVYGSRRRRNQVANKSGTMPARELHRLAKLAVENSEGV